MYRNPVANITPKTVVFDPERSSRSFFKVSVTNTSERFLSFQVRVYPQGAQGSEFHHWYRLKPRVCAKKPPGTTADFEVEIADSPIPGSEGEIPLVFEIQALENRRLATTVQGHTVKVLAGRYLSLNLLAPDNQIRVDAGKRVSIPVRVRNARKKAVEVSLQLTPMALPPDWLETEDVQLTVGADSAESAAFSVVVPQASQTEGERPYEFAIEIVKPKLTQTVRSLGTLIVNPSGVLEFDCPTRDRIFPDDRDSERDRPEKPPPSRDAKDAKALSRRVCYPIELTNRSNLSQTVSFEISPHTHLSKKEDIICRIEPETVTLKPGEQKTLYAIVANLKQPTWFDRELTFDAIASSPDPPNIRIAPNRRHTLSLTVRSLSWAKGLALLLLLLALAAVPLFRYLFSQRHADTVNTVNFIDRGTRVLSGSRDRHLFRWEVNRPLENLYRGWNGVYFTGGGDAGASVRVLRERPLRDSERLLVAAGLTNGEIQLWDAASNATEPIRRWNRKRNGLFDNVFDLSFTPDTRYLFSAHGSGFVRQWDLDGFDRPNSLEDPSREIYLKKATYAIADTDGVNGDRWLLVGGEKNAFWVWNWNDRRVFDLSSIFRQKIGESAYFEPIYSKTDYITTMAVRQRALVTADTQGYVRIWDLEAMRGCLQEADRPKSFEKEGAWEYERDFDYFARNWTCDRPLIRWQGRETHRGRPVRSVALTHQGQCYYLASVGDDGRVVLWSFEAALLEPGNAREPEVRTLARLPRTPLNSVDIFADIDRRSIFVVSDGEDGRIQLYRRRIAPDANCK